MDNPMQRINQLRRGLHVHSVIYYHFHTNVVTDSEFDTWSQELVALQKANPDLISDGYRPELFADWTGDTGMHLPADDHIISLAEWVINFDPNFDRNQKE